jgi:hypothetical protein
MRIQPNPLIPNKELAYKKIAKEVTDFILWLRMILLPMGMMVRAKCKMEFGYRMAFGIQ